MKQLKLLSFLFAVFTVHLSAQDIHNVENEELRYPEYKIYNRNLKTYWMKEPAFCEAAEEIESLSLRCDTLTADNKYLFFDNKGRLRKYWTYFSISDGSHEYLELRAYYNISGELVYLDYSTGSNCEDACGYFILRKGIVTDGEMNEDCGCCEDDNAPVKPFVAGGTLPRKISWLDSSAFSDTATLLEILSFYKYGPHYVYNLEFMGKEEAFAMIIDENTSKELVENTITSNEKGLNRYITVWQDNTGRIRKCHIYKSLEKGGEFIKLYYDKTGNLFLTGYNRTERISEKRENQKSFTFYIESGIITGGNYFRNFGFEENSENIDYKCDAVLRGLIGCRLSQTPYFNSDLSWMLHVDKLRTRISNPEQ